MQCCSPQYIKNPFFEKGFAVEERLAVPCGKCYGCINNRRMDWTVRCCEELKYTYRADFLTLTYDDDHVPLIWCDKYDSEIPVVSKRDLQLFFKRLRKEVEVFYKNLGIEDWSPIRYVAVSEYGSQTGRPHYHAIVYNIPPELLDKLDEIWKNGFILRGTATPASINYVVGYTMSKGMPFLEGQLDTFMLCSRRPGIGAGYVNEENILYHHKGRKPDFKEFTKEDRFDVIGVTKIEKYRNFIYTHESGSKRPCKVALPRYYRDKIFTDKEKKEMYFINRNKRNSDIRKYLNLMNDGNFKEAAKFAKSNRLFVDVGLQEEYARKRQNKIRAKNKV